jgi:hypothetical protein
MYRYLFRQSFRAFKAQAKNYFAVIIGLAVFLAFFLGSAISAIYASGFSLSDNLLAAGAAICAVQLFALAFRKTLVFSMHPAAIHFFYNSKKLNSAKAMLVAKKMATTAFFSFMACLVVYNFRLLSRELYFAALILWIYALACSFARWLIYAGRSAAIVASLYALASALFILAFSGAAAMAGALLLFLLAAAVCRDASCKAGLDWGKYYDDCAYANKIESAIRNRNMAEMQQLAAERAARKKHSIKIYDLPLSRGNALICKAAIETLRTSWQMMAVLGAALIFAALLIKTPIFRAIPMIGEPNISRVVGMLLMGTFWTNLREIYSKQIASVCDKHARGFFIPFTFRRIVFSYAIVCCSATTLAMAALCLVFAPGLAKSLIAIVGFNLLMALAFLFQSQKRAGKLITVAINLLLVAGSGLLC